MEQICLAGGCFWCLESAFLRMRGVSSVVPGYSGGTTEDPSYEDVCDEKTAHAEVVTIDFDPDVITREQLLDVFFGALHDPTQIGGQGPDIGSRYRSMVLYSNEEQRSDALAAIEHYSGLYSDPIVTEIVPLIRFWPAEDFHIDYFSKNPENPYCQMVVSPKLAKVRSKFGHLYE